MMETPITFKHLAIAAGLVILYMVYWDHTAVNHIENFLSQMRG